MFPGLWIDARDMTVAGEGSMRVLLDDTVTLADARGPDLDQGSPLRLLAEMPWYPTALFDARTVTWYAIDGDHACATLRLGKLQVSGIFEFGSDGLPVRMTAKRFKDKGSGRQLATRNRTIHLRALVGRFHGLRRNAADASTVTRLYPYCAEPIRPAHSPRRN
jgi:hypothetical protein